MNNPKKIKTISFITASKTIKYFRTKLTKETKDLHTKNYKILLKKLKKVHKNGKTFCVLKLEVIVKIAILSKAIYRFDAIPTKILMSFFLQIQKRQL